MKLKSLKLKNFGKFTDFEIEYDDKVTKLIGMNGDGKTTVGLTAIWAGAWVAYLTVLAAVVIYRGIKRQ